MVECVIAWYSLHVSRLCLLDPDEIYEEQFSSADYRGNFIYRHTYFLFVLRWSASRILADV